MRKLMPWVLVLLSACGGGAATSTTLVEKTTAGPTTNTEAPVSTTDAPVTTVASGESGGVIPADCAEVSLSTYG